MKCRKAVLRGTVNYWVGKNCGCQLRAITVLVDSITLNGDYSELLQYKHSFLHSIVYFNFAAIFLWLVSYTQGDGSSVPAWQTTFPKISSMKRSK